MSDTSESKTGIWTSLKKTLDAVLRTVENRVELLSVELQEEKCRLVEALLCVAAVVTFGMMALTLITFTLVAVFWENGRIPVLVGLCVVYLVIAGLAWRALQTRLKARSAFSGTLEEIKKDRECLKTDN